MYTVRTIVTKEGLYDNQSFVMYTMRQGGFKPMTIAEAETLKSIYDNYPDIFSETYIMDWEEEDVVLIDPEDDKKYGRPLSFEINYLLEDFSEEDYDKLTSIDGRIGGFDHEYTAEHVGEQ